MFHRLFLFIVLSSAMISASAFYIHQKTVVISETAQDITPPQITISSSNVIESKLNEIQVQVATSSPKLATNQSTTTPKTDNLTTDKNKKMTITPKTEPPKKITETVPEPIAAAIVTTPKPTPPPPLRPLSWGIYTGSTPQEINDFEERVSTNPDYLAYFVHWGNGGGKLPAFLNEYAYQKNRTLVLFWEASDYLIGGTEQPDFSYHKILQGYWDEYFEDFAEQLADYEGPVILIPFSELNGDWTPWSGTKNGNSPEQAVAAYRYVHSYFADLPNVKMGWAVNSNSVPDTPNNQIERYYPGDDYVDIVGVDGFNMNWPWLSFSEIFTSPLQTLSQYNKPVFIFSFGSAEGPEKANWLKEGLYTVLPNYPLVEAWIYFNQNKERNWLLWSDDGTFKVFTDYIEK